MGGEKSEARHVPEDWEHPNHPFPLSSAQPVPQLLPEVSAPIHPPTVESSVSGAHTGRIGGVYDVHGCTKHICKHLERTEVLTVASHSSEGLWTQT